MLRGDVPMKSRWPLQGRERDLDRLVAALSGAHPRSVLIEGPAGVGKTRLMAEALEVLAGRGLGSARVVGTRAGSSLPLGALAPLLGRPLRRLDHASVLDAAREALGSLAAEDGFVLAVDDAHLLDNVSAMVVHQSVLRGDVRIVATVRHGESMPDAITALWKDDLVDRLELTALDRGHSFRLAEAILGGVSEGSTLQQLWRASQGNPMLLRELVRGAVEAGALLEEHGLWRLVRPLSASRRLVELIEARLGELSPHERECVELLALGEPLSAQTLSELAGADTAMTLERRGIVVAETVDARAEIRLAHPLYGDIAMRALPLLRAGALRKRLADQVRATGMRRRGDMLRVATWLLESGEPLDPSTAAVAVSAALQAQDLHLAHRLARVAASRDSPEDVVLLATVLNEIGQHTEVESLMHQCMERTDLDSRLLALATMRRSGTLFWGLDRAADAMAVLDDGAARLLLLPGHEPWVEELNGQRSSLEVLRGNPLVAIVLAEAVLARGVGRTRVEALLGCGVASSMTGRMLRAIALAEEALTLHAGLVEEPALSLPGIHIVSMVLALTELGELTKAESLATRAYEETLRVGSIRGQAWFAMLRGRIGVRTGQLHAGRHWFEDGSVAASQVGITGLLRWCLAGSGMAAAMQGDVAFAQLRLADAWSIPSALRIMDSEIDRAGAALDVAKGEFGRARSRLWSAADAAATTGSTVLELACLHDLVRYGPSDAIGLLTRIRRVAVAVDGVLAPTIVAHAAAIAAVTDSARAMGLSAVSDTFAEIGAGLLAWETAVGAARAYKDAGDVRSAQRWRRRAERLRRDVGGAGTPGVLLDLGDLELSEREQQIAERAAAGITSREIAAELYLSVRTVDNHLRRVYERLGIAGRTELAEALRADAS